MATANRGALRPNHSSRTPPFLIIGFLVVIAVLAFNYWNASARNRLLDSELDTYKSELRKTQGTQVDVVKRNNDLAEAVESSKLAHAKLEDDLKEKLKRAEADLFSTRDELESERRNLEVAKDSLDETRRDVNECDAELRLCHNNVTNMMQQSTLDKDAQTNILEQTKKACDEQLSVANVDVQNQLKVAQSSCERFLNEYRLNLLNLIKEIWGSKALTILRDARVDISGIPLDPVDTTSHQTDQQSPQNQEQGAQDQQQVVQDQQQVVQDQQQVVQDQQHMAQSQQQGAQDQQQGAQDQEQMVQDQQQMAQDQQQMVQSQQQGAQDQQQGEQDQQKPSVDQQYLERGQEVLQSEGQQASQSEGQQALQSEGQQAPQSEGQQAPQSEGQQALQSEGQQAPQSEGQQSPQSEGQQAPQSEGQQAPQSEDQQAPQSEGQQAPQSEGQQAPQSESQQAPQSEGQQVPQSEGRQAPQSEGQQTLEGQQVGESNVIADSNMHQPEGESNAIPQLQAPANGLPVGGAADDSALQPERRDEGEDEGEGDGQAGGPQMAPDEIQTDERLNPDDPPAANGDENLVLDEDPDVDQQDGGNEDGILQHEQDPDQARDNPELRLYRQHEAPPGERMFHGENDYRQEHQEEEEEEDLFEDEEEEYLDDEAEEDQEEYPDDLEVDKDAPLRFEKGQGEDAELQAIDREDDAIEKMHQNMDGELDHEAPQEGIARVEGPAFQERPLAQDPLHQGMSRQPALPARQPDAVAITPPNARPQQLGDRQIAPSGLVQKLQRLGKDKPRFPNEDANVGDGFGPK